MICANPDFLAKGAENIAQEALDKASQTDYAVTIASQLSNMGTIFSMPATGVAVVHPRTNTVDLYFSAAVENEPSSRPTSYGGPDYYVIRAGDVYTFTILGAKMIKEQGK